jgi:quinol-cytochrome oxidoreductase complex cytochrome b subunit
MGAFFAFGVVRSAWVWRQRKPWVPITTRVGDWLDSRYQLNEFLSSIFNKPVPVWATRWWYCLGGITAFLFVIQGVTGVMLALYYQPTPEGAYASIQFIETQVRFGAGIRAVHHWAANGMVVMCVAHMLRVFIMGAFKPPRELNWSSGVILLITTMLFGLTGYLLPWDQRAFWATTVASEIAGGIPDFGELVMVFLKVGWEVTAVTLSRFYALHVLVLPLALIAVMGLHFIMIRRQGLAKPL